MALEREIQALKASIEASYDDGDFERWKALVAPDYVCRNPAAPHPLTADEVARRIGELRAAFPDLSVRVEDLFGEGDRAVARVVLRGTHRGPFLGVPPTGNRVEVGWIEIDRFENGKIAETWYWIDMLGLLHQIGATTRVPAQPDQLQPA